MAASETLTIIIRGRDEVGKNITKLNKGLVRTEKQARRTGRAIRFMGAGLARLRSGVLNLRTAFAGLGLVLLARKFIQASNAQQKAIEGLNASLRAMGRFSPELTRSLQDVATQMQSITNFGDEATIEGQKFLATYRNIGDDVLPRATKAMLDYAALTGGDTVQAANALGKASIGMVGDLRRVGIIVSSNTFAVEGFVGVLKEIEDQVGGQAEAMRKATGSMIAFGNVTGDTGEFLGDLLKLSLEPLLKVLVEEFDNLNAKIQKLKDEGQLHIWAQQWSEVILNGLSWIGKAIGRVAQAIHGWRLVFASISVTFTGLVAEMLRGARDVNEKWQKSLRGILNSIGKVLKVAQFLPGAIGNFSKAFKTLLPIAEQALDGLQANNEEIDKGAQKWTKLNVEALDHLVHLEKQKDPYKVITGFIDGIVARAKAYTKEIKIMADAQAELAKNPPVNLPSFKAQTKSALLRLAELTKTHLAELQVLFDKGKIGIQELFAERTRLLRKEFEENKKILDAAILLAEANQDKQLKLKDDLFKLTQKLARDEIALERQKNDAIIADAERVKTAKATIARLVVTVAEGAGDGGLEEQFKQEREALLIQQAATFATLETQLKGHKDKEALLRRTANLQMQQEENLIADQRVRSQQATADAIKFTLGGFEQAFGEMYEATGKKIKIFAKLQRAAAISQTLIATYESAQQAYKSAAGIPLVGSFLAPIAAAAAIAAGFARVAAIRAQTFALGGKVEGSSPSKTADNVPIMATAGEYVHPVDTVRHYGTQAMEAIRKRLVPKELLSQFAISPQRRNFGYAMQAGGSVPSRAGVPSTPEQRPVVVANFYDPEELTRFLATSRGQDAVINAIAGRRETVRRVIS